MKPAILPSIGIAACLLLAGCMETMPGPERPPHPRPTKPLVCTQEYAPVCAAKGWHRKTFGNACMARAERYKVISQKPCEDR